LQDGQEHRFGKTGVQPKRPAATLAIVLAIAVAVFAARLA
jgi:hypothetical protein